MTTHPFTCLFSCGANIAVQDLCSIENTTLISFTREVGTGNCQFVLGFETFAGMVDYASAYVAEILERDVPRHEVVYGAYILKYGRCIDGDAKLTAEHI